MSKTLLVLAREYRVRFRRPSFWWLTLLLPFFSLLVLLFPLYLSHDATASAAVPPAAYTERTSDSHEQLPMPENQAPIAISRHRPSAKQPAIGNIPSADEICGIANTLSPFAIYLFMLGYGSMVMLSTSEERRNHISGILATSLRPSELLLGKLLGIFCLALTQFLIWMLVVPLIVVLLSTLLPTFNSHLLAPFQTLPSLLLSALSSASVVSSLLHIAGLFALIFPGAYLLYGSLFATLGAISPQGENHSQLRLPIFLLLLGGCHIALLCQQQPTGDLAFWASLFPLTSPMVLPTLPNGETALWQIALSLILLYLAAIGCLVLAARIYHHTLCTNATRPSLRQLWQNLRH